MVSGTGPASGGGEPAPAGEIGVVLPQRETFGVKKSGAVALCARDFAAYSRFSGSITIFGAAECEYPEVRYQRLVDWRRWWLRNRAAYLRAVIRTAKARRLAVVEAQNLPKFVAALRKALPGVGLALHLHNDPQTMEGARAPAERRKLLERLDAVYCVSAFVRERFLEGVADDAGKTIIVHNGIAASGSAAVKTPIVAYVGRVIRDKGIVELTRAFAAAAPDLPGWRLVIAGTDAEALFVGPRAALARERDALGEKLTLLGQVSHAEAMDLFARAEIAAVPSIWREPFGRTAVEAMGRGCALIATREGALAEVVGDAGLYVDARDIDAFAATLRRLADDATLRRALQARALARAREAFDIRRTTAVLDAARARLLGCT
jgi:glycosyltransferase involved in cell wall biosynthesis